MFIRNEVCAAYIPVQPLSPSAEFPWSSSAAAPHTPPGKNLLWFGEKLRGWNINDELHYPECEDDNKKGHKIIDIYHLQEWMPNKFEWP